MWPLVAALVVAGLAAVTQLERDKKKSAKTPDQIRAEGIAEGKKAAEAEAAARAADERRIRRVAQRELAAQGRFGRYRPRRDSDDEDDDPPARSAPPAGEPAKNGEAKP